MMNSLKPGVCGFFFTVDGDEKRAVREAFNLIDRFITMEENSSDKMADECDNAGQTTDGQDVSDFLSSECQQIRQKQQHFISNSVRQYSTGARCSLFFSSPLIHQSNVYKVAEKMVEQSQKENLTRFLARVIPVEETCSAKLDQIETVLSEMIPKHLNEANMEATNKTPTYAVDFKASNTKLLKREQIYDGVAELMKKFFPEAIVNLTEPDLLIVVHTIRTVTMLSIISNYYQRRKFALKLPLESDCKQKDGNRKQISSGCEKTDEN